MRWYHSLSYFFGGAFPSGRASHLGNGLSGHAFQVPFAHRPERGCRPGLLVNVLWGLFNLAVGYLLVCGVGNFDLQRPSYVALGAGVVVFALMLAKSFARFHGGL